MTDKTAAESRREGLQLTLPRVETIRSAILAELAAHPEGRTAEEIQYARGFSLNNTRSRLSELYEEGLVDVVGRRSSMFSGVNISVWALSK